MGSPDRIDHPEYAGIAGSGRGTGLAGGRDMRTFELVTCHFLVLAGVALSACSADSGTEPASEQAASDRTPIGKADATGSCGGDSDHCGGKSDGNCWCDADCSAYGDCCSDVEEVCSPAPTTCASLFCAPEHVCVELCAGDECEAKCVSDATCAALMCGPGTTCAPYPGCSGSECPARCVEPTSCATLLCPPGTLCFQVAGCSGSDCQAECLPDSQ